MVMRSPLGTLSSATLRGDEKTFIAMRVHIWLSTDPTRWARKYQPQRCGRCEGAPLNNDKGKSVSNVTNAAGCITKWTKKI